MTAFSTTKTKQFFGIDKPDLDKQLWDWRLSNPRTKITKQSAVESLPLEMRRPYPFKKLVAYNSVSLIIEYDD